MTKLSSSRFLLPLAAALLPIGLQAQSEPTVFIKCHIVDDVRGEPVARARLALTGGKLSDPVTGYTDANGSCSFGDVAAGSYTLSVDKAGFFPRHAGGSGNAAALRVEATAQPGIDLGDVTLVKTRSISGAVAWQNGEPVEHAVVHALLVRRGKAAFRVGDARLAPVNERGDYRLDGLQPGRYVVYSYPLPSSGGEVRPRVALPVFYPNSPTPDVSGSIDLRKAADASHIDMRFRESTGTSIEGAIEASPEFPKGSKAAVVLMIPGNPAQPFAGTYSEAGVPFKILDVPQGTYTLIAAPSLQQYSKMRAIQRVEVSTVPITGIKLTLIASEPIAGVAEIERAGKDGAPGRSPVRGVLLNGRSEDLQLLGVLQRLTNAAGEFHLEGAIAGQKYQLDIQAPKGMYVAEVTQGNRTLEGAPFPIVGGGGPMHVLLKDDVGTVDGTIKKDGASSPGFVVAAPAGGGREHLFRTANAGLDGAFHLADLAPGDYEIFAFDRNDEDMYFEEAYRDEFRDKAVKVTVTAKGGQQATLELQDTSSQKRAR